MQGDRRIERLLTAGDLRAAATAVIETYGPPVLNYLRAVLRDEDLAGDAFSLFAEWVWSAIGKFRGASTMRTWAFGVAWNAQQRVRNDAWRRRGRRFRAGEAARLAADIRTHSALRRDREAETLKSLRSDLTAEEQNLLVLRIEQKLEWSEIALVLSSDGAAVTTATLRKRFERLKERIGRLARERGLMA